MEELAWRAGSWRPAQSVCCVFIFLNSGSATYLLWDPSRPHKAPSRWSFRDDSCPAEPGRGGGPMS